MTVLGEICGLGVAGALEELLDAQLDLRTHRRLESARRTSRLPHLKTLEDFDFTLQPSVERTQMASLHELGFLRRHENVVFCGPPGVGKTIRRRSSHGTRSLCPPPGRQWHSD